jgi:hypothetical protein
MFSRSAPFGQNFERVNIFPRASKLFSYLQKRLKGVTPYWEEPMPGDRYDVASGRAVYQAPDRVNDENFGTYAARFYSLFATRRQPTKESDVEVYTTRPSTVFWYWQLMT